MAAGAIPVSLCGTRDEPIAAAEETLPRNLCPLIKSSYGFAVTDTCPYFYFSDLIVGETTCDGKKKMFEMLREFKPVHVMQLPHLKESEAAIELWISEVRRLRTRLEDELNVEIRDENIWKAIDLVNREVSALKALCDLNRADPPPLSGLELMTVLWTRNFYADRDGAIQLVGEFAASISSDEKITDPGSTKPRVLLTGCPVGQGSEKVISLIEELGGTVVAMENCSGYKTLGFQTEKKYDDPIVALAHKYIQMPCSCMSPNPYRLELLGSMIGDFHAHAVVDLTWQACHTYNIEASDVKKLVKSKGIPYLHLETDYSSSDLENLKVRLEAMLEMVSR
jgi:benzoyl-CoA reductase/2-hydroxyglutaryl-CoA dehydratase subunit BcrC/BadD/HgdB